MKVICYSTSPDEKALLEEENASHHHFTWVNQELSVKTVNLAQGTMAIVVFITDDVNERVIDCLSEMGVRFILTRSVGTDHIDLMAAKTHGIQVANIPSYSPQAVAEHTVALALALSRNLIEATHRSRMFNFSHEGLLSINLSGKTVGLIGLGHIGSAVASIFLGFGCIVLAYDLKPDTLDKVELVDMNTLLRRSDLISLHIPLTEQTKYIIDQNSLDKMKNGVMILNTARGGLIDSRAMLAALKSRKVGYLGLDVYEYEKGLFFRDHRTDLKKDPILSELMGFPNVILTPHLAFLTKEALVEIARHTIKNLDDWSTELG